LNQFFLVIFINAFFLELNALPVGPGADLVPDVGAGALGGAHLTMSVKDVSGNDLAA